MGKAEKKHDGAVMRLVDSPPCCIDDVLLSAREVNVWGHDRRLIKKPDGVYMDRRGNVYLMEYKSSESHRSTAEMQLRKSAEAMFEALGVKPKMYFAYNHKNHFEVEEIF